MLYIQNLFVSIDTKEILTNITFSCAPGSVVACLGPNGSGKSSLLFTLMGHPTYNVTQGMIQFDGKNLIAMSPDERARAGIFLTFQQPYEIPGVLVSTLLKESFRALNPTTSLDIYIDRLTEGCQLLQIDRSMLDRAVHAGFSGGEKKKLEMLQAYIAQPKLLLLDEIDSGLDVDARRLVGTALQKLKALCSTMSVIIVTHHDTLFSYLSPDVVHVFAQGRLRQSGDRTLLSTIGLHGYGNS